MKSLVIGKGQVGSSLYEVIKGFHESFIKDIEPLEVEGVEVLHICIPFSESFIDDVNDYVSKYKPSFTIVHSSVVIGTTEQIKGEVCYSPIRGKHPNLSKDILTFEKFIAGRGSVVVQAVEYFQKCNIKTHSLCDSNSIKTLEFCKLASNIRYGYEICFMQEVERISKKFGLSSEVFNLWETSYNVGYSELGQDYMTRPILKGGLIGGHCVMQNVKILGSQYYSEMLDWINFSNVKKIVEIEAEERGAK